MAARCKYVQFFLGRNRLTFLAPLKAATPFDLTQVLDETARPFPQTENRALRHLALGLRGTTGVAPAEVRLFLFDSGEVWLTGETQAVLQIPTEQRFDLGIGLDHGFAVQLLWRRAWFRSYSHAGEHSVLYRGCANSPVEVLVDQRPVNDPGEYKGWGPGYQLATLDHREGQAGIAITHLEDDRRTAPLPIDPRPFVRRHRAVILSPPSRHGNTLEIRPFWDGVALKKHSISTTRLRGTLVIVCAGSYGLTPDLSEFQAIQDANFDHMLKELKLD